MKEKLHRFCLSTKILKSYFNKNYLLYICFLSLPTLVFSQVSSQADFIYSFNKKNSHSALALTQRVNALFNNEKNASFDFNQKEIRTEKRDVKGFTPNLASRSLPSGSLEQSDVSSLLTSFNTDFNTSGVCADETEWLVPITVGTVPANIGAISLVLDYDATIMTYDVIHSAHPALNIVNILTSDNNGKLSISWANSSGAAISNSTMMTLKFVPIGAAIDFSGFIGSTVAFSWDQSATGNCELADNTGNILSPIFNNQLAAPIHQAATTTLSNSTTNNAICIGNNINFTANGGVLYEFFVNNVSQGTPTSTNTFSINTLVDQDTVKVIATNVNGCSATDEVVITVANSLLVPTLILNDADSIICSEDVVEFTASGGASYEFFINNISQGTPNSNAVFNANTLTNGDIITVEATNIGGCSGVSAGIPITVKQLPNIGLSSDATANSICPNVNVNFTASGGVLYEFFINNNSQGTPNTTPTFASNTLLNGDSVTVIGTGNNACSDMTLIEMTVFALPNIGITTVNSTICDTDNAIFTATNGVSYEFFINNTSQGASSTNTTFSSNTLINGDIIKVVGIDANTCINTSSDITMTVNPLPSTTLTSDDLDSRVCQGEVVNFAASGADDYIFYLNNIQQNTLSTYIHTSNNDGDVISVIGTNVSTGCSQAGNTAFTLDVDPCYDVSGELRYKSAIETAMGNVVITVTGPGTNKMVTTSITDGSFIIPDLFDAETYTFSYATTKSHGGINITDALLVLFESVGLNYLVGLNERAGDVNDNNILTSADAFYIYYRHVFPALISFPAGDWIFQDGVVTPNGGNITGLKLYALAMGDVNASYNPDPAESEIPKVNIIENGKMTANEGERMLIPISIEQAGVINAMSLSMYFPSSSMTIHDVIFDNDTTVLFSAYNNELRVGWLSLDSRILSKDDVLFYIDATIHDIEAYQLATLSASASSEFADDIGSVLPQVILSIPQISERLTNTSTIEANVMNVRSFPNPFTDQITIEYDLSSFSDVQVELFNSLGQSIEILKNEIQPKGKHQIIWKAKDAPAGVYYYRITMKEGNNSYQTTKQIILIK
jgi:hypothetical protein